MGGTHSVRHSHGPLSDADAAILSKFPKLERELLSRMFEDLAHHSTGCKTPAIDRNCFLRVFKGQPGMLGERLFAVFDQNSDGFVDHREFLEGLAIVVHGSKQEKLQFLFKIYDLNGDGHVNYAELSTMLNCAASGAHLLRLQDEIESEDEDHPHSHNRRSSASTLDEEAVSQHVDDLLESAFPGCTAMSGECRERLSPKEFFAFVDRNPEILEILELSFTLHDYSSDPESEVGDVTGRAHSSDVYHEREEKKSVLKKSSSLTGLSKRISFDGLSNKLSVDSGSEKKPHRRFLGEIVTPDAVKQRIHRQHERPVAFKCGECDFSFDLKYCYSCGVQTDVNDCKNCGKLFKIPFKFCPACGQKLIMPSASPMHSGYIESSVCSADDANGRLSRQSSLNGSVVTMDALNRGDSELKIQAPSSETKEKNGVQTPPNSQSVPTSPNHVPVPVTPQGCGGNITPSSHRHHNVSLSKSLDPHHHHHGHHVHAAMHGALSKVGKRLQEYGFHHLIERYYVLRDSFLYTFRRFTDPLARHIMWLEGCVVKPVYHEDNKRMRWGFEVSYPSDETNENQKTFYALSKDMRDRWIVAVRDASHSQDINAYYTFEDQIGVGKFSSVKVCTHRKSQKKYAVKILDRRQMGAREREALRTEIAVMKLVHHPNIIQIRNVYETKDTIYLVMNLVRGGDLFDRIRTRRHLPELSVRNIVWKLLDVVHYLHQRGVVHRDLKPENIMLEDMDHDDHILVGDFGLSKFSIPEGHMNLPCGTLAYVAPEVLKGVGYGKEVDLWSIGIIMYVCLRGALPFDSGNQKEIITLTLAGRLRFDDNIWKTISHEAKDLIRGLLKIDPRQRLTCESAMQHPWFENYGHLSDDEHGHQSRRVHRSSSRRGSSSNVNAADVAQSAPGSALESPRTSTATATDTRPPATAPAKAHSRTNSHHANTLPPPSSSSHHHSSSSSKRHLQTISSSDRRHHSSSHRSSHHRSSSRDKKRRSVPSLTGTAATATSGGGDITRSQTMSAAPGACATAAAISSPPHGDHHYRPTRSTSHHGHSSRRSHCGKDSHSKRDSHDHKRDSHDSSNKDKDRHHRSSRDRSHDHRTPSRSKSTRSSSQPRSDAPERTSDDAATVTGNHTTSASAGRSASRDRQVLNTQSTTTTVDSAHSSRKSKSQHLTTPASVKSSHTSSHHHTSSSTTSAARSKPSHTSTSEKSSQHQHKEVDKDKEQPAAVSSSDAQKDEPPEKKKSSDAQKDEPPEKEKKSDEAAVKAIIKEADVAKKDADVVRNDADVAKKDAVVVKKDAAVVKKDAVVAKKDADVVRNDAAVVKKDATSARRLGGKTVSSSSLSAEKRRTFPTPICRDSAEAASASSSVSRICSSPSLSHITTCVSATSSARPSPSSHRLLRVSVTSPAAATSSPKPLVRSRR